ncbi:MAG: hypothetical protein FVQ83_06365 [Chloroflexi bacterium]|nr:hypothetical protein [Chloroflexota bacterium]
MTSSAEAYSPTTPNLTQKRILIYWLPLAASWLLMATEGPVINGALARMFDAELMIAAFGIVVSLSITIESPVIPLLSTSTALSRSRQSYLQLRRFTLHLMVITTIIHALMGWTVLFDIIVDDLMGIPEKLLESIRLGMRYMLFWSAAIAWRRFKQGVLIRHGKTRFVGQGTAVRLTSIAATVILLAFIGQIQGVIVGALALNVGVIAEALYAQWAASKLIAEKFSQENQRKNDSELKYFDLVKFHSPLAASMLLFLLMQPLIGPRWRETPIQKIPWLPGPFYLASYFSCAHLRSRSLKLSSHLVKKKTAKNLFKLSAFV